MPMIIVGLTSPEHRHIETLDSERRRGGAAPVSRNLFGPHVARAMKSTKHCDEAALFFLRLAGDPMRSLTGWCRETRQPVDLQLYVDYAPLAPFCSHLLRFQSPPHVTQHYTAWHR